MGEELWAALGEIDHQILVYMASNAAVNRAELESYTNRSNRTISTRLNKMIDMGVIKANGRAHDPKCSYSIVYKTSSK